MADDSVKHDVVNNLVNSINDNNKALTAGDIGYRYLLRVLEEEGHSQLIYEMNSRNDVPGYGFQLAKGATALTESWPALKYVSNNHLMLGHIMEWFYSGIAGIKQATGSTGYKNIIIAPEIVGDLTHAGATLNTIHGRISSSWYIENGTLKMKICIPVNCSAVVEIPHADPAKITESGLQIADSKDIKNIKTKGDKTICEIASGDYIFISPFKKQ
jgi:hypothetical protein